MTDWRETIADTLRGRVIRGMQSLTLRVGDRLPSAPELAKEFLVDPRVVTAAYRVLETEGLVERRPRGGVYVAARSSAGEGGPVLPEAWLADVLVQGLGRELPAPDLHEWFRRCLETLRLQAVVVTETVDQGHGLARELRDDFGLDTVSMLCADVLDVTPTPLALRRADLLITTRANEGRMHAFAASLHKHLVVIDVRPELVGGEYAMLLRRPVYVVVASEEFGAMLRHFYRGVSGIENLRIVVHGRDSLSEIPDDAPTYVTQRVRVDLGDAHVPGRLLPPARAIASDSAREIFMHVVRLNIEAMAAMGAVVMPRPLDRRESGP